MVLLTGCASEPRPQPIKTEFVYYYPPKNLLVDCSMPPFVAKTWAELALDNQRLSDSIVQCSRRLKAARELINKHQTKPPSKELTK